MKRLAIVAAASVLVLSTTMAPAGVIHRRQKPLTPTVSRFIELLREANEEPARAGSRALGRDSLREGE